MSDTDSKTAAKQAEAARARIAATVEDIQDRLSPRRIIGDAASDLQNRGSDLLDSGARLVREHPVALSLIGLSLGLLLLKRDSRPNPSDAYQDVYGDDDYDFDDVDEPGTVRRNIDKAQAALGAAKSSVSSRAATARARASDSIEAARERSADIADRALNSAKQARRKAADSFDDNPLAAAVLGVAAGALIGSLLPRTDQEDEWLGESRDRLAERARAAAKAAIDAGRRELDERGLNLDTAKAKISDLGEQAKTVARTAGQAAADQLKTGQTAGNA